jgi:orotate phosphoribosyltransferase
MVCASAAKEHGSGARRGAAGERVVLIEDLVSFGGSSLGAVEALRKRAGR